MGAAAGVATTERTGDHMADASTPKSQRTQIKVTEAVYLRFVPLGDLEPIEATISRQTAEELLDQLGQQLRPEPVADDGQPTA